jgi:HSP20 family protein
MLTGIGDGTKPEGRFPMMRLKGDPLLAELQSLSEDVDRAFGRMLASPGGGTAGWMPSADIYETEDDVVIELDVPGVHGENLSVEAVDGQLVIAGERQPTDQAKRRFRAERWSGKFVRTFGLQPGLAPDDIRADYHDGVLTLRLRKPEETKPKRISIQHGRKQITEKS